MISNSLLIVASLTFGLITFLVPYYPRSTFFCRMLLSTRKLFSISIQRIRMLPWPLSLADGTVGLCTIPFVDPYKTIHNHNFLLHFLDVVVAFLHLLENRK